jgi:zinc and cadmium transporter
VVSLPTLGWIIASGIGMSLLAFTGVITLALKGSSFDAIVMPLVALAAGSLLGGALFHMLPASVAEIGNSLEVYVAVAAGLLAFLLLEQYLHWHHCHRSVSEHRPLGYLILIADGVHNFIGGLAVGTAFVIDTRLGITAWIVAAAHEVPQELGDFGILVHSGWSRSRALAYNSLSALTFLLGGLVAYAASASIDVTLLLPFAAGNFIYIALADLVPELKRRTTPKAKSIDVGCFTLGLAMLLGLAIVNH